MFKFPCRFSFYQLFVFSKHHTRIRYWHLSLHDLCFWSTNFVAVQCHHQICWRYLLANTEQLTSPSNMITSALGPSETSLPSIPAKQKKLFFISQPLGILIFRLLCQTLNEYLRLHYWESTSHLSLHLCICKQDAYENKSASLLIITAEVARFEHSGTTHIIYRSYHVLSC